VKGNIMPAASFAIDQLDREERYEVEPRVKIRQVTPEQAEAVSRLNALEDRQAGGPQGALPDYVEYSDGGTMHAPETIAAYCDLARKLPTGFGLLYLHCGVQVQCLNPLLPSLLFMTGHRGAVHALRRGSGSGFDRDVMSFARAMTPPGGATLVLDDPQIRLGHRGQIRPARLTFLCHRNTRPAMSAGVLTS
jgi:hypothetical protein